MRGALERATRLLVIGWRATEQLFLEEMREARAGRDLACQIVGGSADDVLETYENIQSGARIRLQRFDTSRSALEHGFSNYLTTDALDVLLHAQV
jgi:hypothetical protein